MKQWTRELLEESGYVIKTARISSADVRIRGGELFLSMELEGDGWGCEFGHANLGWASFRTPTWLIDENTQFIGVSGGSLYIVSILTILGVSSVSELVGNYVRVAIKDRLVKIVGNIVKDFWFDEVSFWDDPKLSESHNLTVSDNTKDRDNSEDNSQ